MNIGLDFDGVIADTTLLKQQAARELFGLDVAPELLKEETVVSMGIMTREQYRKLAELVCGDTLYGLKITECIGAKKYISALKNDGHTLCVITSRDAQEVKVAEQWCKEHDIELVFISVGYGISKASAAKEMRIHAYMDDDLHKLEPLVGIVPYLFLFETRHNAQSGESDIAQRVSWQSFYEIIKGMSKETFTPRHTVI